MAEAPPPEYCPSPEKDNNSLDKEGEVLLEKKGKKKLLHHVGFKCHLMSILIILQIILVLMSV